MDQVLSNIELILNYKNEVDELNLAMINANPKLKNELKELGIGQKNREDVMYLKIMKYFLISIITIIFQTSNIVFAITEEGVWKPQIVEKMYILPAKQLNKVLSNDFKSSSLAAILNDKDIKIKNRHDKINNLNETVSKFNGEEKIELQHQLIIEKKII